MNYTKEDYKYDLIYYLSYLKNNSSNCYNINVNKIYNNYKNELNNIKNIKEFFNLLLKINDENFPYNIYGHNNPMYFYFNYDNWGYSFMNNKENECFINIFNKMNKIPNDIKEINNKLRIEDNKTKYKPYELSIIKNNNNEDVMMIKMKSMRPIFKHDYDELKDFLIKNKDLKELYIDIRGNGGGNITTYKGLFDIIFNRKLNFKHKQVKYYFKYTKFNKPFIKYKLGDNIKNIIKSKKKNNKYTHYIIKKFDGFTYPKNKNSFNINYQGKIFIIMDHHNFSSAQCLLDECQGNKNIIILGDEISSGFGHYESYGCSEDKFSSAIFLLPKTKILCRMDLFFTDKNKYKTKPDLPIP